MEQTYESKPQNKLVNMLRLVAQQVRSVDAGKCTGRGGSASAATAQTCRAADSKRGTTTHRLLNQL